MISEADSKISPWSLPLNSMSIATFTPDASSPSRWSFVFLILAFTGHTSLWLAILADTGATLLVIMNALRLLSGATNLNPRDL